MSGAWATWRAGARPRYPWYFRDVPQCSSLVARTQRLAVALLAVIIVLSAPTAAMAASRSRDAASDANGQVESARRAANAEAGRYLAALSAFESLRTQAAGIETVIAQGEQRAARLEARRAASARHARVHARRFEPAVGVHRR